VARGTTGLYCLPAGLEQAMLGETHEDRIERAGLEAREPAEVIAISPLLRSVEQFTEYKRCLGRSA
jgi:hypothetical protein